MNNSQRCPNPRDLDELLASLPQLPVGQSLGPDLDEANTVLLDERVAVEQKEQCFRKWASRFQPCMFGRLGAKNSNGIHYDICLISRADLRLGTDHVREQVQRSRRAWKDRAAQGMSSGFLILFNAVELSRASPGPELVAASRALCDLFLVEQAPVVTDVIYTEAVPLRRPDGSLTLFKGGINVFYGGAHRTRNHDRRVPGGLLVSVNSPGHLANSLVQRGLSPALEDAVAVVRDLAWRSIGNGGIAQDGKREQSCSWHNLKDPAPAGCPMRHRPKYVPENFDTDHYSALYHTDVLVPSAVTRDARLDVARAEAPVWSRLDINYFATEVVPAHDPNYAFVHGHPIPEHRRYDNPWQAQTALNALGAQE